MPKAREPRATKIDAAVGGRIREARIARGWNQTRLAKSVGVSFQQFQKYENGTNRVSASRLYLIAGALGVSIDDLVDSVSTKNIAACGPVGDVPWTRETMQLFKYALRVPSAHRRALINMAKQTSR